MSRSLLELLALRQPLIKYYVSPYILSYGGSLFIYGSPGTWKSWLAIDLAFNLSMAKPWLCYPTNQAKVLIIQSEQVEAMYQERITDYLKARPLWDIAELDKHVRFRSEQNMKLDNWSGLNALEKELQDYKSNVVIIDCLYRSVGHTNDHTGLMTMFEGLSKYQSKYGTAFVILHHPRKGIRDEDNKTYDSGYDEMTGDASISRWADTILKVDHINQQEHTLQLLYQKVKNRKKDDNRYAIKLQVDIDKIAFNII